MACSSLEGGIGVDCRPVEADGAEEGPLYELDVAYKRPVRNRGRSRLSRAAIPLLFLWPGEQKSLLASEGRATQRPKRG